MIEIQVYGSGCKNCVMTAERITQVSQELGLHSKIEKVTSLEDIMTAGVLNTPGVAVNGMLKHTGSVPSIEQIHTMLGQA